jgi:hypothetical protein
MRNVKLLIPAVALAAVSSLPLAAQQPSQPAPDTPLPSTAQPQAQPETQSAPAQQSASPAPGTASAPEVTNADLRPVSGELVSKLDTKNAKNGDPVVVKTTEKATFADGVVLPKGSKIMGHVTDVQAHDQTNPTSKVAIQFDQAELKGGQTMPIKSVLQSVEPGAGSDAGQTNPPGTGSAPGAPATSSAPGAGAIGSPSGSASGPRQQGTAPASATPGASPAPSDYPAAGTVVARQGNVDIKTTAIPGVLIAGNANGQPFSNASGALLGARQNIHLDGGTKVTLAVAAANANASNR